MKLFSKSSEGSKPRGDLEKGKSGDPEKPLKKWGPFKLTVAVGILVLLIFLIILFAACHVLPSFISEHCQDNGSGNAAIERVRRWVDEGAYWVAERDWESWGMGGEDARMVAERAPAEFGGVIDIVGRGVQWRPDR